jgi:hypothetical protein
MDTSNVYHSPNSGNHCKLELPLVVLFKKACESNTYIVGTYTKERAFQITAHLGTANFPASNGWIDLRGERTLFTELLSGNSRSVDPATIEDRKITKHCKEGIKCYDLCDIYTNKMRWPVFSICNLTKPSFLDIFVMAV